MTINLKFAALAARSSEMVYEVNSCEIESRLSTYRMVYFFKLIIQLFCPKPKAGSFCIEFANRCLDT
jgi:hypothetical protein